MSVRLDFDSSSLFSVAGGQSVLDTAKLNIHSVAEAESFLKSYGYDYNSESDVERLWYFYRRALVLMTEKLNLSMDEMPEILHDRKNLTDLRTLLIFASDNDVVNKTLQKWSCAILRCMHVYVHAETDLFSYFSEEIQKQILSPIQDVANVDGAIHKTILKSFHKEGHNEIELEGFEVKPLKTSSSTVVKLLAKPDAVAMKIFDKLGVRFITKSTFDSFQVIRFLVEENIISFPHIMPDQSSNNIYSVELFLNVCYELSVEQNKGVEISEETLNEALKIKLAAKMKTEDGTDAKLFRKQNDFSADNYKFIKFITRKLITIQPEGKEKFSFFYPYEIQIVEKDTYDLAKSGPSEHDAYKNRQREAARHRLFQETE